MLRVSVKGPKPGEHGMPKAAVQAALLTPRGVEGDHNVWRTETKKGDPDYAVLLMSAETLRQLAAEGWPVMPGDIGENLTTEGVPYEAMQPGTRWRAGDAELEVSKVCEPCTNLYALPYIGDTSGPLFLRAMLGRRGWYARVTRAGMVRTGDPFEAL